MSCDKMGQKSLNIERDGKKKTGGLNKMIRKKISQPDEKQDKTIEK